VQSHSHSEAADILEELSALLDEPVERVLRRRGTVLGSRALDVARGPRFLRRAPTPEQGASLSLPAIRSALKHAGRQRNTDQCARDIQAALRPDQLVAPTRSPPRLRPPLAPR
jgi:hypothetical protein